MMRVGEFEISIVSDGEFRVDGGAIFGVVPKPLWERLLKPDGQNRVQLGTNCLLVRRGEDAVLIEAGIGRKFSQKSREIYAVSDEATLEESVCAAGVEPGEVTHVVLTHLHFDHCGGATKRDEQGRGVPVFPNARHCIQRGEWDAAMNATPATDTAYDLDNVRPLDEHGVVELIDGDTEIVPGVRAEVIAGHTHAHQVVRVESGGEVLVFSGDLVPTTWHVRTHYNAAYDLNAEENMLNKAAFLDEACGQGWYVAFYHDPVVSVGLIEQASLGQFAVKPVVSD